MLFYFLERMGCRYEHLCEHATDHGPGDKRPFAVRTGGRYRVEQVSERDAAVRGIDLGEHRVHHLV